MSDDYFDDTVFTLKMFNPQNEESENQNDSESSSDSIIQEEQDEKISSILQDFPDLSANDCLLLLEESNFDVEKAKRNAFANFQYQKEMEETNKKTYLKILKEEFPQVDESIILNALEAFNNDYLAAKFAIQENTSLNKPCKTKKKKNLLNSDGNIIESPSSPKRPRKVKRKSELYPNILPKNENKNREQLFKSNQKQEYQTNDNNDIQAINETEEFQESNLNENQKFNSSQKVYQNPSFITLNNFRTKQKTDYYDDEIDDYYIDEINFYRNMMPKKSSKCAVKKTNRMPQRYYIPEELCVRKINLHGFNADDVHERVIRELKNAKNSNIGTFHFITGAGHHSQDNTPILKPLVLNLCKKWGYKPTLTHDGGCVVCKIK